MQFFRRFSPLHAFRDLRFFLSQREPRDLGFLVAAMAITGFFVYAFMRNDIPPEPYQPNIIYFKNYAANRTDAQNQGAAGARQGRSGQENRAQKAREEKLRSQFKSVDDAMTKWGAVNATSDDRRWMAAALALVRADARAHRAQPQCRLRPRRGRARRRARLDAAGGRTHAEAMALAAAGPAARGGLRYVTLEPARMSRRAVPPVPTC